MVFYKWYLIKSISAVTNYNSSSCLVMQKMQFKFIKPLLSMFDKILVTGGYDGSIEKYLKEEHTNTLPTSFLLCIIHKWMILKVLYNM